MIAAYLRPPSFSFSSPPLFPRQQWEEEGKEECKAIDSDGIISRITAVVAVVVIG